MNRSIIVAFALVCTALSAAQAQAQLQPILQFNEPLIAIDIIPNSRSRYPGAENPPKAIDGIIPPMGTNQGNKYLNFGIRETGLLVTPVAGATTVTGIQLATANDGIGFREPSSYALFGTNDAIDHGPVASGGSDNGDSLQYNWTLISQGPLTPPATTNTLYPVVNFANATPWTSYRVLFPTTQGATGCCMQVAEVRLLDAGATNVLSPTDGVSAFQLPQALSQSPSMEGVQNLVDLDPMTKYLNFGKQGTGFIVTPSVGPKIVKAFEVTTANDAPSRDPASWQLYGTNDPITSGQHSTTNAENWTLVDQGTLSLPTDRLTLGPQVAVNNSTLYSSYRLVFPTQRDPFAGDADSMQFSEVQLYGVPEPATLSLVAAGLIGALGLRRKS
jgi:hypothetical protein